MQDVTEAVHGKWYTLRELAELAGAEVRGDPEIRVNGVGTLEESGRTQVSFLTHRRYAALVPQCRAAAVIVGTEFRELEFPLIVSDSPYLAMALIARQFWEPPVLAEGIHERAYIGDQVRIAQGVRIGPLAHIGSGCCIGESCRIYGGAYLGTNVQIGDDCIVSPGVCILDGCVIGNRVVIHSGTVIGSDGYGFAQDHLGHHVKIPQMGIVRIDDDVEIGANCALDRATFGQTWVRKGVKIDNLVQIGHNVTIGEHSLLVGQVGVSGSTQIGRHVVLAGQVGVVGHIKIGDGVRIGAQSGVSHSIHAAGDYGGAPARPHKEWLRTMAGVQRLPQFREELRQLRARVRELEERLHGE